MNYFFGCWSDPRSGVDCQSVAARMSRFFLEQRVNHALVCLNPHFSAGVASFITAQEELEKCQVETDKLIAVGDVTLYDDNSVDRHGVANSTAEGELLRVAGAHQDENALSRLNGDFAVAVFRKDDFSLTLIRDHCGMLPLHYSRYGDACAFSSLVRPLLMTPWATQELDTIALATFPLMGVPGRERTFYRGVSRLLPASRLCLPDAGRQISGKFWTLKPAPRMGRLSADDAYAAVREQVIRATIARTRGFQKIGVTLSGGLDSSTVAGIVCTHFPNRLVAAASNVLPKDLVHPVGDERAYQAAMVERYSNLSVTLDAAENADVLWGAEQWSTWLGAPVLDAFSYRQRRLAVALAESGAQCVLSGHGGDYCVSLWGDQFLTDCFVHLRPGHFLRELRRQASLRNLGFARILRSSLLPHLLPSWLVRLSHSLRSGSWQRNSSLSVAATRNEELVDHLRRCGFFSASNPTLRSQERENISAIDHFSAQDRVLDSTLGLTLRYPLLDRQLLEVCNAIDSKHKVSATNDRMLIRTAGQPFLPELIVQRQNKGWYSPDYREHLASRAGGLRQLFERSSKNTLYQLIIDQSRVATALARLEKKPLQASFNPQILTHITFPYRVGEFLAMHSS